MDLNDPQLQPKCRDTHPLRGQSYKVISSLNEIVFGLVKIRTFISMTPE